MEICGNLFVFLGDDEWRWMLELRGVVPSVESLSVVDERTVTAEQAKSKREDKP